MNYKLIVLFIACVAPINLVADTAISLSVDNTNPDVGEQIRLTLNIRSVEKLFGVQFTISHNPEVVSINSILPGNVFTSDNGSVAGPAIDKAGSYNWSYHRRMTDPKGFSGSGVLAYIDMIVVGNGIANIKLTDVVVANIFGESLPVTINASVIVKVRLDDDQKTDLQNKGEGSTSQTNASSVANKVSISTATSQTASTDGRKSVRLAVSIDNAERISGVAFVLYYNPSVVSIDNVAPGEIFTTEKGSMAGHVSNNPGTYSWSYNRGLGDTDGFSGSGTLAYINLMAPGNGDISFSELTLYSTSGEKIQTTIEKPLKVISSLNAFKATSKMPPRAMTGQTISFFKRLLLVLVVIGIVALVHLYVVRHLRSIP